MAFVVEIGVSSVRVVAVKMKHTNQERVERVKQLKNKLGR